MDEWVSADKLMTNELIKISVLKPNPDINHHNRGEAVESHISAGLRLIGRDGC